eukprot:5914102-Lingulodinium_polyedra.AAC.1
MKPPARVRRKKAAGPRQAKTLKTTDTGKESTSKESSEARESESSSDTDSGSESNDEEGLLTPAAKEEWALAAATGVQDDDAASNAGAPA